MLRTRFEENLCRIFNHKNISRGFADQSSNLDSNTRPDIKFLGREFQMCDLISEVQILDSM